MIPMKGHREVSTSGVEQSTAFGVSFEDIDHIKSILRDGIYSDKVMAVIREYSANAWDAHRMCGKGDVPIRVRVPTWDEPTLVIEDFGPGLSHDDIFNVFTQYGRSTKRGTNAATGKLGIGSKAGFCYGDTFTITSRHGGKMCVYVAKLDEDDKDSLDLMTEIDWDGPTGLTITIAVRQEDAREFTDKAKKLFQYFDPRPDINIPLPTIPRIKSKLKHGLIYDRSHHLEYGVEQAGSWVAMMGCVPYTIDLSQLKDSDGVSRISDVFSRNRGVLEFPVGAVEIASSREALRYNKVTKDALVQKFEDCLDEFVKAIVDEIESTTTSNWEKRVDYQQLRNLGFSEKELGELAESSIKYKPCKTFTLSASIKVDSQTRMIRYTDSVREFYGYQLYGSYNVLVEPQYVQEIIDNRWVRVQPERKYTWDEIEPELQEMISESKINGIPLVNLHELPWRQPFRGQSKSKATRKQYPPNPKHTKKVFRFTNARVVDGYSECWEIVDRTPTPEDVFVVIEAFQPLDCKEFFNKYDNDKKLAITLGLPFPEVYGYKTTSTKPVDPAKIIGSTYDSWREEFFTSIRTSQNTLDLVEMYRWSSVTTPTHHRCRTYSKAVLKSLAQTLGSKNPVTLFIQKSIEMEKRASLCGDLSEKMQVLNENRLAPPYSDSVASKEWRVVQDRYPLLYNCGPDVFWGNKRALHWRQYVRLLEENLQSNEGVNIEFSI